MEWLLAIALAFAWLRILELSRAQRRTRRELSALCDQLHKAGVIFPGLDLKRSAPPDWYGIRSGAKPLEFW